MRGKIYWVTPLAYQCDFHLTPLYAAVQCAIPFGIDAFGIDHRLNNNKP